MAARSALGMVAGGFGLARSIASLVAGLALIGSSLFALGPFGGSGGPGSGSGGPGPTGGIAGGAGPAASIILPPTFPIGGAPGSAPPPSPSAPPAATPAPTVAPPVETPTPDPATPEPATPEPPADEKTWFADAFDEPGGWPTGAAEFYTAGVVASTYVVEPRAVDLPVYLWAATDGGPGQTATIEATVDLRGEPSLKGGVAFGNRAETTRIALFVHASGAWDLTLDDLESYRTVLYGASGAFVGGPNQLRLRVTPHGTEAWLNGASLGRAPATIDIGFVGLAVQALDDGGRATVDDVLVTVPR